jgi:hypothetical protein
MGNRLIFYFSKKFVPFQPQAADILAVFSGKHSRRKNAPASGERTSQSVRLKRIQRNTHLDFSAEGADSLILQKCQLCLDTVYP